MFYVKRPGNLKEVLLKEATFLYAAPGTGKTEFIKEELMKENNNIIYIDLSSIFTLKDLSYAIIKETSIFFNKRVNDITKKTDDFSLFKSAIFYPIYESEDKRFNDLIICFDNFNYIQDFHLKNEDEIFRIIADILQKSDVKMIFTLNNFEGMDIFLDANSSLFDFVKKIDFSELEEIEILKTVNEYLSNYNISLNIADLENLIFHFGLNMKYLKYFIKELIFFKRVDKEVITECIERVYEIAADEIKKELVFMIGKKNLSDILYYVAAEMNVYQSALEYNDMKKSNIKLGLNNLENLGLILQKDSYKKYICRDNVLKRYILEKFNKRVM